MIHTSSNGTLFAWNKIYRSVHFMEIEPTGAVQVNLATKQPFAFGGSKLKIHRCKMIWLWIKNSDYAKLTGMDVNHGIV